MKKKRVISILATLVLMFAFSAMINAVEYAYDANKSVRLRWNYKEGSQYTLPVNNGLPSSHQGVSSVNSGISKLNSQTPSNIAVKNVAYSNSKVDFMIPSTQSWNDLGKNDINPSVVATTVPKSTNGTFYIGFKSLPNSGTIYVDYAMIWYNPSYDSMMSGATGTGMAMHEMLHVFGMGHATVNSMTQLGYNYASANLTTYDIQEFRRMYP